MCFNLLCIPTPQPRTMRYSSFPQQATPLVQTFISILALHPSNKLRTYDKQKLHFRIMGECSITHIFDKIKHDGRFKLTLFLFIICWFIVSTSVEDHSALKTINKLTYQTNTSKE